MKNSYLNFATRNAALAAVAALVLFAAFPLNAGSVLDNSPSAQPRQAKTLYSFLGPPDGHMPQGGVVKDSAGNLYGTLLDGGVHGAGAVFELSRQPDGIWSETIIYSFHSQNDGRRPVGGMVLDAAGNLYGTTEFGGTYECAGDGCGTVFELSPQSGGGWMERVLYNFKGTDPGADGSRPLGAMVFDGAGNLYGTTQDGGNPNPFCSEGDGCGTVFELSPESGGAWNEKLLYTFAGGSDGEGPLSRLIFDANGNLYGTTYGGDSGSAYGGTAFELVSMSGGTWSEKVLHSFPDGPNDGFGLEGGLTLDAVGNLYGTTSSGGNLRGCFNGCGTVFELSPESGGSWAETVLYAFVGGTDGIAPAAGVIFDAAGNLYSTTAVGGAYGCLVAGCGTVFKLSPQQTGMWAETILHNFTGLHGDGWRPTSDLISDPEGHLYSATQYGGDTKCVTGDAGCGTVFKVIP